MVITVASHKGGVGKSTTAVHIAAYLVNVKKAKTVLVDSDPNRSVCGWAANGSLPFEVIPLHQAARRTREFEHIVIDTNAGLRPDELREIQADTGSAVVSKACCISLRIRSALSLGFVASVMGRPITR